MACLWDGRSRHERILSVDHECSSRYDCDGFDGVPCLDKRNLQQQLMRTLATILCAASLLALASLLNVSRLVAGPTNQTSSPVPGMVSSSEGNYGMPTNGIFGVAQVVWDRGRDDLPIIDVRAVNTNLYGFRGEPEPNPRDVLAVLRPIMMGTFLYFAPTNLFCGPVQLIDASGRALPLLKPEVSSMESYPFAFSVSYAKEHNPRPGTFFPAALNSSSAALVRFRLSDYFDIKLPGEYSLKVWPKIYKRPDTNSDIAQRIDLPPVSVIIKWDGATNK
jgi:hypothetical protein